MSTPDPLDLTPAQETALLALHSSLLDEYAKDATLRQDAYFALKCDHPDEQNLRYLKTATNNVPKALHLQLKSLAWRKEVHLDDDIMPSGEPGALTLAASPTAPQFQVKEAEHLMRQFRIGKSFTHGVDVDGRPVTIVVVKLHRGSEQPAAVMERFILWQIESVRLAISSTYNPPSSICSGSNNVTGKPVADSVMLFDLESFGLANMDYTPVKFIIETFAKYYPEGLGLVVIHKSPWIFKQFWKIIRGWIPEGFREQVHFTKDIKELDVIVPRAKVATAMGGDDPWVYSYKDPTGGDPLKGEADKAKRAELEKERLLIADKIDEGTRAWIAAVKEGKPKEEVLAIRQQREVEIEKIRKNYWQLDPYVRARGLLDEWGLIKNPLQ